MKLIDINRLYVYMRKEMPEGDSVKGAGVRERAKRCGPRPQPDGPDAGQEECRR